MAFSLASLLPYTLVTDWVLNMPKTTTSPPVAASPFEKKYAWFARTRVRLGVPSPSGPLRGVPHRNAFGRGPDHHGCLLMQTLTF